MKTCKICKQVKSIQEYGKNARYKTDGLDPYCTPCKTAKRRARNANPVIRERLRIKALEWARKNANVINAKNRERYKQDPTKYKETVRAYRKRHPWAKRELEWKQKYGITRADYDQMLVAQGGGCAICGVKPSEQAGPATHRTVLHIDHDHATGKVRGLLCIRCNRAIGLLNDDADTALSLVLYLVENTGRVWLPIAA